jgi:hypothetical protein
MDAELAAYLSDGEKRAMRLGNRGPLHLDDQGKPAPEILDAYWEHGFYVFENPLSSNEAQALTRDFETLLDHAPADSKSQSDRHGQPAAGLEYSRNSFVFTRPLSDPNGATDSTHGRYPARMHEPAVPRNAPDEVLYQVFGILHLMDSALTLYGHPGLLAVAEAINGPDFCPFTDTIWVKPAGLGASVSWHQDGTTHWDSPTLDRGTHGFNFMIQMYDTNAENALWVVPGTHTKGKIDIAALVASNHGSDRLPGAVPMLAQAGDIAICNRQVLHGSFANTSNSSRATLIFGFHRHASVAGIKGWAPQAYDEEHIRKRSQIVALAIDARHQRYPQETPYTYAPFADDPIEFSEDTRRGVLTNYNLNDIGI